MIKFSGSLFTLIIGKGAILTSPTCHGTMFSDYPRTLHDQIHNFVISRALSLITCQKHVLVCKIKF